MTDQLRPSWADHAPLPWSVDDVDQKCVRDARWTVLVDLMTGNDEADAQLARLIADAGNGAAESRAASAEAEVERYKLRDQQLGYRVEAAEAITSALRDRVAVLESALKPFADYAEHMPGLHFGDGEIGEYFHNGFRNSIRTHELKAARAALNGGDHV